MTIFTK